MRPVAVTQRLPPGANAMDQSRRVSAAFALFVCSAACHDPVVPIDIGDGGSETGGSETGGRTLSDGASVGRPSLVVRILVDPDGPRLDNLGQPTQMPPGHAGQDPIMHRIGAHHVELVPNAYTLPGQGAELFHSPDTAAGGELAVDFEAEPVIAPGETILRVALDAIDPGTYAYLRVAVSYQEYDVTLRAGLGGQSVDVSGRVVSFLERLTYITSFDVGGESVDVGGNRPQGYFAFKTAYTGVITGQAPPGATTVPNPIDATSPIEVGSCIVTGVFPQPLTISGHESDDIVIDVSLSTNKSFEWDDTNGNGHWEPLRDEMPVDMGIRGMTVEVVD